MVLATDGVNFNKQLMVCDSRCPYIQLCTSANLLNFHDTEDKTSDPCDSSLSLSLSLSLSRV